MLSLEKMRKLDPSLKDLNDDEVEQIRVAFYEAAQLAFDAYWNVKNGSKNPIGSLNGVEKVDKV